MLWTELQVHPPLEMEVVEDHAIRVPFVRSHDNLADFFAKHLPAKPFFALRKAIMNIP